MNNSLFSIDYTVFKICIYNELRREYAFGWAAYSGSQGECCQNQQHTLRQRDRDSESERSEFLSGSRTRAERGKVRGIGERRTGGRAYSVALELPVRTARNEV